MYGPGNGHWVRARTDRDAKLFLKERELEESRRRAALERDSAFDKAVVERVRRLWAWMRRS